MDGSQKLPQRILETVIYLLKHQRNFQGLALAIASWIKYVSGKDLNGKAIDVRDPMADEFFQIAKNSKNADIYIDAILDVKEVFPKNLRDSSAFRIELKKSYNYLEKYGSLGSIKKLVSYVEK